MVDVSRQHAGQLDGLRAVAVAAVLFSHTIDENYAVGRFMFFEFGSYGVYLFFALSAYLITAQLIASARARRRAGDGIGKPLRSFYAKRALRLLPAYYLALIGATVIDLGDLRGEFPWHAAMLSEWLFAIDPITEYTSPAGHFWTLSVEWQFYLVWPLLILTVRERFIPWVIGAVLLLSAWSWSPLMRLPPVVERANLIQSLDSLMFGAALAFAQARGWSLRYLPLAGWIGAAVFAISLIPVIRSGDSAWHWWFIIAHEAQNLTFTALIAAAAAGMAGWAGRLLDAAPMQYIGRISYGIYLYHMFILVSYEGGTARIGVPMIPYGIGLTLFISVISVAAAALSWHYFELPINRLRTRLNYRAQEPDSNMREPLPTALAADHPGAGGESGRLA
jgi:peptidoglycan/LPS O-acetylase OafA/YrhL